MQVVYEHIATFVNESINKMIPRFFLPIVVLLTGFGVDTSAQSSQSRNDGFVSLPETVELALVVSALSELGRENGQQIDRSGAYFQEVEAHFAEFADQPAVTSLSADFNLPRLAGNAADFAFDSDGRLLEVDSSGSLWNDAEGDLFRKMRSDLEAFAQASDFRGFYEKHRDEYAVLIEATEAMINSDDMQNWLEAEFSARPGPPRVIVSPLMAGLNWTTLFKTEQRIWIKAPNPSFAASGSSLDRMRFAQWVFTEVDHAYVNPSTAKLTDEIAVAFANTPFWASSEAATNYPTAELQFNEYMTWAVFLLYASDNLAPDEFITLKEEVFRTMVAGRGFRAFEAFADQAMLLRERSNTSVEKTIPSLMQWSRAYADSSEAD